MRYSGLVQRISGDGADAWRVHAQARDALERGEDVILLSVGDPDLDTPAVVVDRAVETLRAGDTHYTPATGREPLRAAIAAQHRARCGQSVGADEVVFLAGAQNALFAASLCLAGPGDEVIAFEPLYPTYPASIEVSGARLIRAPAPAAGGFRVDARALEALITPRTRALFFASPNNPSGVILRDAELDVIAALARRHDLWVVADEVYAGLAPGGRVPSLAARCPERLVTISSLSKTHAMPGWRAGWMVGPRELMVHVEALAMCMLYGLPGFVQEAALTALSVAPAAEARIRDLCTARRDVLLQGLRGAPGLECFAPEAGMFMLVNVEGGAFGNATRNFVRVCFAADEAQLREACARLRRFAQTLPARAGRRTAGLAMEG